MTKSANYSAEELEQLMSLYAIHGTAGIDLIAEKLGKTVKSVRSKLVWHGLYKPLDKAAFTSGDRSKKVLLRELEQAGLETDGLEGATKPALERILNIVQHRV